MYYALKDDTGHVNIVTVYLSRTVMQETLCDSERDGFVRGLHLSLCKIYQDFNKQSAI